MSWIADRIQQHAMGDRVFIGGTGQLSMTGTLGGSATFTNPNNSGKTIYLYRLVVSSSKNEFTTTIIGNPTSNLPTTSKSINHAIMGSSATPVAQIKADLALTPLSGGTPWSATIFVGDRVRTEINYPPLILKPGNSIGFSFSNIISWGSLDFYWWEE